MVHSIPFSDMPAALFNMHSKRYSEALKQELFALVTAPGALLYSSEVTI
jgi:hypothetical protein